MPASRVYQIRCDLLSSYLFAKNSNWLVVGSSVLDCEALAHLKLDRRLADYFNLMSSAWIDGL